MKVSHLPERWRNTPPPYPSTGWVGRYDDSATFRARLVADDEYPVRWVGVTGVPGSHRPYWRASGRLIQDGEHAVYDRWQRHLVVASGLTALEAEALSDRLEIEQERCGQRPTVCWLCPGEILIRDALGRAMCRSCWKKGQGFSLPVPEVSPCPWPATVEVLSPKDQQLLVCHSHAALWAAEGESNA